MQATGSQLDHAFVPLCSYQRNGGILLTYLAERDFSGFAVGSMGTVLSDPLRLNVEKDAPAKLRIELTRRLET